MTSVRIPNSFDKILNIVSIYFKARFKIDELKLRTLELGLISSRITLDRLQARRTDRCLQIQSQMGHGRLQCSVYTLRFLPPERSKIIQLIQHYASPGTTGIAGYNLHKVERPDDRAAGYMGAATGRYRIVKPTNLVGCYVSQKLLINPT